MQPPATAQPEERYRENRWPVQAGMYIGPVFLIGLLIGESVAATFGSHLLPAGVLIIATILVASVTCVAWFAHYQQRTTYETVSTIRAEVQAAARLKLGELTRPNGVPHGVDGPGRLRSVADPAN